MGLKDKHKEYNVNHFRSISPWYDLIEIFVFPLRNKVACKVRKQNSKIIEFACGTGSQSIAFAKKGHSVVGIDLSPDMLSRAKKKVKPEYKIKLIHGDAVKVEYPDSLFDVSCVSFALHDMPEKIGLMILKEMKRVTKKGGQIIIVEPNRPGSRLIAWLGYNTANIWESKYFKSFMKIGLDYYLKKAKLIPLSKETFLLSNIQIIECVNNK